MALVRSDAWDTLDQGDVVRWQHRAVSRAGREHLFTYASVRIGGKWFSSCADDNTYVPRIMDDDAFIAFMNTDDVVSVEGVATWADLRE